MPSLLCSESVPFPGVVEAAAVVVANEGNTVGDELPRRAPPTIEPCPGMACVMLICCSIASVVVVDVIAVEPVSAAAIPDDPKYANIKRSIPMATKPEPAKYLLMNSPCLPGKTLRSNAVSLRFHTSRIRLLCLSLTTVKTPYPSEAMPTMKRIRFIYFSGQDEG